MWILLSDMPSLSGASDMDYPLQGPGLLSVPNLPELSAVRRVPLPPELVEQFGRILLVSLMKHKSKPFKQTQVFPSYSKVKCFCSARNQSFNLTFL